MRIIPAGIGALVISYAVFLFMQSLIQRTQNEDIPAFVHHNVAIIQAQPEKIEESLDETEPETPQEPALEPLTISKPPRSTPEPLANPQLLSLELGVGDLDVGPVGGRWVAPLGEVQVAVGAGQDARGFVEVVPYDTRRPNVPEVAWENKIDGWVLVAFQVTREGRTSGARVLDAKPRGVFEEKVLAAIEDWRYQVDADKKFSGSVVLTQKVEVQWRNYPQNLPYVD